MSNVLRFWRDVEIFNIPDTPTPKRPGASGKPAIDDTQPDLIEPDMDEADGTNVVRPRGKVVQRFDVDSGDVSLPWFDARFRIALEPEAAAPVDDKQREPASYAHAVYLGVAPKQRFVECILQAHGLPATDDELYRPATGEGWMSAFLVGGSGVPLEKTYVAASFVVGSGLLREGHSLDEVGEALRSRSADFDERMDERRQNLAHDVPEEAPFPLSWQDLLAEWELARQPLAAGGAPPARSITILSVPLYRRKDGSLNPPPEQAATFLNSFFIDDLTALVQGGPSVFGATLTQYTGADSPPDQRLDLLADPRALAEHIRPAQIPAGRWPEAPERPLSLAQQAAVYQVLHRIGGAEGGMMAINGPPGTGKTTLLKELIADVVVRRAMRLAHLGDPRELFTGGDDKPVPSIRPEIVEGTEIVVASSNNAAVQNISFELPFSCDRDAYPEAAYLPEVAALVAKKFKLSRKRAPWGLLAGALGAKRNREKIGDALMGYEPAIDPTVPNGYPDGSEPASLKRRLDWGRRTDAPPGGASWQRRWKEARQDFEACLARVKARQTALAELEEALRELPGVASRRDSLHAELDKQRRAGQAREEAVAAFRAEWAAQRARDEAALQALAGQAAAHDAQRASAAERLDEVREVKNPGWLARAARQLFGIETRGYRQWKDALGQARAELDERTDAQARTARARLDLTAQMTARCKQGEEAVRAAEQAARDVAECIAGLDEALCKLDERQAILRARLAAQREDAPLVPDATYFALPQDERHRHSLWVTPALDRERGELFLAALRLHEASLMANAAAWFNVLRALRGFLAGRVQPKSRQDLVALWQALFFVVPVASTTLASFGRLFQGLESGSLGWVLIDEAGQAPPAAVAGALWRARRAVIVGDPLQIEPIVTVPRKLIERLGTNRGMDEQAIARWSPALHSAQTVADRTMRLGAQVGDAWTGLPLRTHRRCMDPMFTIANRIAYDDQMVQATQAKYVEPDMHASCWIDVRGPADGKVVVAQIEALRTILSGWLADWPCVVDRDGKREAASFYVISPFRDVAQACKDLLHEDAPLGRRLAKQKRIVDAGTVHTFQGKEASIVFLVLGSAEGNAGAGSRGWAAAKPNLLNVAVTRAQQRFYVIGNYTDWAGLPFFRELAEPALHMRRTQLGMASGAMPGGVGGAVRLAPA